MKTESSLEPTVVLRTHYEDEVIPRSAIFGLIRWEERLSTRRLEKEIVIYTDDPCKVTVLPLSPTSEK